MAEYKRQYGTWIKWKGYGRGLTGTGLWFPGSFSVPNIDPNRLAAFGKAVQNHQCCMDVLQKTLKNYYGKGVDIHAMIGKLPAPKKGWTLPGYKYTEPYNPHDKQVKLDPETGDILEIYNQPTGTTDAIAMLHDVNYATYLHRATKYGENEKQCKLAADRKMVKSLDAVPYHKRQWGHRMARNAINSKQKLGLGAGWS